MFWDGKSPREIECVVCGAVPVAEWTALGLDPENQGLHCAAHREAFHAVCECTENCCDEPYDPDRDYEWR